MTASGRVAFRDATPADARAIAALHAKSWQVHYRGAYRDAYLDAEAPADRRAVWDERFARPAPNQWVVVAEDHGGLVGFACAYGADDPRWGTLLDNIHVAPEAQDQNIGSRLLSEITSRCRASHPACGLYLWVLTGNERGRRFYERHGAVDRETSVAVPPGGGEVDCRRYAWTSLDDVV